MLGLMVELHEGSDVSGLGRDSVIELFLRLARYRNEMLLVAFVATNLDA